MSILDENLSETLFISEEFLESKGFIKDPRGCWFLIPAAVVVKKIVIYYDPKKGMLRYNTPLYNHPRGLTCRVIDNVITTTQLEEYISIKYMSEHELIQLYY
jgi:hypothetical protein